MTKDTKSGEKPDQLVASSTAAPVELSEAELGQVTGGDTNKTSTSTTTTKTDKQTYLVYTLNDALIS